MLIMMRNPSVSWCSCGDAHLYTTPSHPVILRLTPDTALWCETCPPAPRSASQQLVVGKHPILSVHSWNIRKCSFSCSQPSRMHFGFKRMSKPFTEILRCKKKSPSRERLCASIPFPLPEEQFEAGTGQRGKWYSCRHPLIVELCSSAFEAVSTSLSITDCYPYFCKYC